MSYQRNGGQATLPAAIEPRASIRQGLEVVPPTIADLAQMAEAVHKSGLWPQLKTPQQVLSLMLLCQADGLHPMQAIRRYHIIEGCPSMRADAMLAEYQRRGGRVRWMERTPEVCQAHFSHPTNNPEGQEIRVTLKELVESGVAMAWNKDKQRWDLKANYRRHPRQMLTARAISEGVRLIDPGVVAGIYTPEEVEDFEGPSLAATAVATPHSIQAPEAPPESSAPALPRASDTSMEPGLPKLEKLPMPEGGSPETDKHYRSWLDGFLSDVNLKWADYWSNKLRGDVGGLPDTFISFYRLQGHLLKHFGAPPSTHGYSPTQKIRYMSVVFDRDRSSVMAEAVEYARLVFKEEAAKVAEKLGIESEEEVEEEPADIDDLRSTEGGNDD